MFRFYKRTSANRGYSNGLFIEGMKWLFVAFVVFGTLGLAVTVMTTGDIGSLALLAAICFGGWLGWRRH